MEETGEFRNYIKNMQLKLRNYKHNEKLHLVKFIYLFLTAYNDLHDTVDVKGNLYCHSGKMRSLGDITTICQNYYPTTTQVDVKEILLNFGKDLVGHFCDNIKRRVYVHLKMQLGFCQGSQDTQDEFGDSIRYRTENLNLEHCK